MNAPQKAWRGLAMEGWIASWYAKNTGKNLTRFLRAAEMLAARFPAGSRLLEVAHGPGFLAVELARRGFAVSGLDVSASFLQIAAENAEKAGVRLDLHQGDAAHMPFPAGSFAGAVCMAAFKNFTDPDGALRELHRVLAPGGVASVLDLRKETDAAELDSMQLDRWNRWITRWTFERMLIPRAYANEEIEALAQKSPFPRWEIARDGVGFELRLYKE